MSVKPLLSGLSRRAFVRAAALAPLAAAPAGCFGPDDGPREIKFGRDACAHCAMLLEDPRYAAQIRGGPGGGRYVFDDVGCAVQFAASNPWARRPDAGFWAADFDNPAVWLPARAASYRDGMKTPMDLGFAAVAAGRGPYDFQRMFDAVTAKTGCAVVPDPQQEKKG